MRAILAYADRLALRGHEVSVVVPAKSRLRALWLAWRGEGPTWVPGFSARVRWVDEWRVADVGDADVVVATAWQSAAVAAAAPVSAKYYLVQHYESLYHGNAETVDATYRLPLQKIVVSTWLRDIMRERFASEAEVIVTPVDPVLFHPVDVDVAQRSEERRVGKECRL